MSSIEDRVAALEKSVRRWRVMSAATMVCALAMGIVAADSPQNQDLHVHSLTIGDGPDAGIHLAWEKQSGADITIGSGDGAMIRLTASPKTDVLPEKMAGIWATTVDGNSQTSSASLLADGKVGGGFVACKGFDPTFVAPAKKDADK